MNNYLNKKVSVFETSKNPEHIQTISFYEIFDSIKKGRFQKTVNKVRSITDPNEKSEFKRNNVAGFTTSGIFPYRRDSNLEGEFTGIICLDMDFKDNPDIDLFKVFDGAMKLESTFACHRSISGNGLAIYVAIDELKDNAYKYTMGYYEIMLDIKLDRSTSNLSRLRYISSDPRISVRSRTVPLTIPDKPVREIQRHDIKNSASDDDVWELAKTVISNGDDPTSDFFNWFKLGCAIASEYGQSGRDLFQLVSSNYPYYDREKVDRKFDEILRLGNYSSGKGTIIYLLTQFQ